MSTQASDKIRAFGSIERMDNLPAIAADIIYMGSAVGQDGSGNGRPLVAGDPFRGFADEQCDNAAGAAAAKRISLKSKGHVWLAVTGINSPDDLPCSVFASDDDTFTTTAASNSYVGKAVCWDSVVSRVLVEFNANKPGSAITDASTAHALNATFSDTEAETALNALGTKINAIIAALEAAGIIAA